MASFPQPYAKECTLYVRSIDLQALPVEGHVRICGRAIFKLAPAILHTENLSSQDGVIVSVFGAFALLAVLGIRYPLKMLPLLFFEFVWKVIWVVALGLPLLLSGGLDPNVSFGGQKRWLTASWA